jgi:hypothetical protein
LILQFLGEHEQTLHQGGYTPTLLDKPILQYNPTKAQARTLANNDIATFGDTYATPPPDVPINWKNLGKTDKSIIHKIIQPYQTKTKTWLYEQEHTRTPQIHKTARIGHIWFSTKTPTIAYEIKGWDSCDKDIIHWRKWTKPHTDKTKTKTPKRKNRRHSRQLNEDTVTDDVDEAEEEKDEVQIDSILHIKELVNTSHIDLGAGGSIQAPFNVIFPDITAAKRLHYELKGDTIHPRAIGHDTFQQYTPRKTTTYPQWFLNTLILIAEQFTNTTPTTIPTTPTEIQELILLVRQLNLSIYTDGGYKKTKPEKEEIFFPTTKQNNNDKATAGIVLIDPDPTIPHEEHTMTVIHLTGINEEGHMVAYDAEFIAINWANYLNYHLHTSWPIHSDCKSAVDTIKYTMHHHKGTYNKNTSHHLQNILRYGLANNAELIWVQGHVEKRKPNRNDWVTHDWGNYFADLAATEKWRELHNKTADLTIIHLQYNEIILDILPEGEWVILGPKQTPLGFKQAVSNINNTKHNTYKEQRDISRATRGLPPKWNKQSYELAGKIWKRMSFNIKQKARATKHIYDWTWHGRNQGKSLNTTLPCPLCGLPDTQYHMFMECTHENIRTTQAQILQDLENTTQEITDKTDPHLGTYAQEIHKLIKHPPITQTDNQPWHAAGPWLGTWNPHQVNHLLTKPSIKSYLDKHTISHQLIKNYQDTTIALTLVLTNGIRQLFSVRTQLLLGPKPTTITIQPGQIRIPKIKKKKSNKSKASNPEAPDGPIPPSQITPHHPIDTITLTKVQIHDPLAIRTKRRTPQILPQAQTGPIDTYTQRTDVQHEPTTTSKDKSNTKTKGQKYTKDNPCPTNQIQNLWAVRQTPKRPNTHKRSLSPCRCGRTSGGNITHENGCKHYRPGRHKDGRRLNQYLPREVEEEEEKDRRLPKRNTARREQDEDDIEKQPRKRIRKTPNLKRKATGNPNSLEENPTTDQNDTAQTRERRRNSTHQPPPDISDEDTDEPQLRHSTQSKKRRRRNIIESDEDTDNEDQKHGEPPHHSHKGVT